MRTTDLENYIYVRLSEIKKVREEGLKDTSKRQFVDLCEFGARFFHCPHLPLYYREYSEARVKGLHSWENRFMRLPGDFFSKSMAAIVSLDELFGKGGHLWCVLFCEILYKLCKKEILSPIVWATKLWDDLEDTQKTL